MSRFDVDAISDIPSVALSSSAKNSGPSPSCIVPAVVVNHIRITPATKSSGQLFCPPNGSDALQARPLQALVDNFSKFSTQTQPSFAASAKEVSLGSITLIVLTNLYPCPSKGGGRG